MYQSGQLDQLVGLYSRALTADGSGGATATWTKYADVWAYVKPMTGGERLAAMRTEAKGMYLFVIRNRSDIKESDSITWNGRDLNVRFVRMRNPRDLFLEVEAEIGARK